MKRQQGFTLIEILISMTILIVGLVGILALFPVGLDSTKKAIEDSNAAMIAESAYACLRAAAQEASITATTISFQYFHDGIGNAANTFNITHSSTASVWIPGPDVDGVMQLAGAGATAYNLSQNSNWVQANRPIGGRQVLDRYSFNIELSRETLSGLYNVVIRIFRNHQAGGAPIKKFYSQIGFPIPSS